MKFLVDVCAASRAVCAMLTESEHDVLLASDVDPRAADEYLLALATRERRIIITEDKDFGELVFVRGLPHPCIIRFVEMPTAEKIGFPAGIDRQPFRCHAPGSLHRGDAKQGAHTSKRELPRAISRCSPMLKTGTEAHAMTDAYRRKLIEVDLPLDAINAESAREKSIRHGHPSTLHLWWARRPLAACRAVIFASMVDDPSSCPDEFPTPESQAAERERLHDLIRRLVKWESTNETNPINLELIAQARWEIARSVARSRSETPPDKANRTAVLAYLNDKALPIYDPFCGGGSIPLEAQRLGLRAVGSDLNPVAVLITKALIELPHKFANQPPVNPDADKMGMFTGKHIGRGKSRKPEQIPWRGAAGLADDIRYYGRWMRERAWERIGHLYPKAKLPNGNEATVIAWLWARTVPCPNPACGVAMPLMKTFQLSTKRGNEHWTRPVIDRKSKTVSFVVQDNPRGVPTKATVGGRVGATCVACNGVTTMDYVREQANAGAMGEVMTGVVAEGDRKRLFVSATDEHFRGGVIRTIGMETASNNARYADTGKRQRLRCHTLASTFH